MKRLLILALAASLGHVPSAFAAGSLLQAGTRHVQEMAKATATVDAPAAVAPTASKGGTGARAALQSGQGSQQRTLEGSGMRTRTKVMIVVGAGVGFAASIWAIDHHVVDVTPSSLGTRKD